jgi:hypothetical protein
MKLWIDDVRPAPEGYIWLKTVNDTIRYIEIYGDYLDFDNNLVDCIEIIDIDHDAGNYASYGGDYIKLLDWLEETGRNYPIHIHSMNPVGIANMKAIIERNGWKEV